MLHPNASSTLDIEMSDHWSKGQLHAGLWLWLPVIIFTCHFAMLLLPQVLGEEEKNTDWQIGCTDKTFGEVIAQGQSHSLGLRRLGPVVCWVIMSGDYIGCSGWPGLLQCSDMPYALHDALPNCLSGHWILLLISSAQSAGTVFAC